MKYQVFQIKKDYKSVNQFLRELGISQRFMTFLRKELGRIRLNDIPITMRAQLHSGDKLEIISDTTTKSSIMRCILPINIVYEDEYYLIVNKPAGLATIPTKSHYSENLSGAVMHYLDGQMPTLRVVNRLDIGTSGLVIFAKNLLAYNKIGKVDKVYYAICEGIIDKPLTIDKPIATLQDENGINIRKREISESGKHATTFATPISHHNNLTLVKLTLLQGRTHQIRVHMSSIGHPLLGDSLYGNASPLISHPALICKELTFTHPFTNQKLNLSVDFTDEFKYLIEK